MYAPRLSTSVASPQPRPVIWWLFQLSMSMVLLLFIACGGDLSVSLPGCEDCPERCVRTVNNEGRCVDCLRDAHCQSSSSPTRKCLSNKCVCGTDKDCPQNKYCDGSQSCADCLKDSHCQDSKYPVCLEKKCVQCNPGAISSCSPEGVDACVKGQQKCGGSGFWGPCDNFLVCKPDERCVQSKCYPSCPEPAPCKEGERLCTTPADVLSGRFKVCQLNTEKCWEWGKEERFCGGKEVCEKGQCIPFTCNAPECQLGESRCTDSTTFSVCGRDPNGCVVWLAKEPCPQSQQCQAALGKCTFCEPKSKRSCYIGDEKFKGVGECKAGEQFCKEDGSEYGSCLNMVLPQREVCNDKDDDCDGQVDEDFPTKGNDCETGIGACKAKGKLVCKNNGFGTECFAQNAQPKTEDCNGIDDDCDGQTDNQAGKTDPIVQSCYTGDAKTKGVGPCKGGTQTCVNAKWDVCAGEITPKAELCDKIDNDCDGQVDEDFTSKKEVCNGKDDNCNGQVDEGLPLVNFYPDKDNDGYGDKNGTPIKRCATQKPQGYAANKDDCCDSDPLAKPGQSGYFFAKNRCNSFDYNCDGKETANVPVCACSRTTKYADGGVAYYYLNSTRYTWLSQSTATKTYTNSTACDLVLSMTMQPSGDRSVSGGRCCYDCSGVGSCGTCLGSKKYCTSSYTYVASGARRTWTPLTGDSKRLVMWTKAQYKSGCVYHTNSTTPKCGEEGYKANALESSSRFSIRYNETLYSGTSNCHGKCSFSRKAVIDYKMNLDTTTYTYSRPSSVKAKVECH